MAANLENKEKNLVQQSSINNLAERAKKTLSVYSRATGSSVCFYDSLYRPVFECEPFESEIFENETSGAESPESAPVSNLNKSICPSCIKFHLVDHNFPCHSMHIEAIKEANKKGGSYIYQCNLGLLFWVSPIYTDGSFSGAIRGSGYVNEKFPDIEGISVMCNNEISRDKFMEHMNSFPAADMEKLHSLAEMLLLCAEALSSGNEDYHEILRRRAQQQDAILKRVAELKTKFSENGAKPGYPLEKERMLIAALRRGDAFDAKKQLNELMAILVFSNPENFKYIQLRVTELVVLISRVEVTPGKSGNITMESNNRSLRQVQESKTIEELTDILYTITDRISGIISSFNGIPHASALRKAESFIMENFTRKISLKEIADSAGLSAPYFSTIFREEMGENLSKYLNRLRVEKASRLLLETEMPLSEIAGCCCFEDQSWFSKIFKTFTGISPGKYRNQGGGMILDICENNLSEAFRKTLK